MIGSVGKLRTEPRGSRHTKHTSRLTVLNNGCRSSCIARNAGVRGSSGTARIPLPAAWNRVRLIQPIEAHRSGHAVGRKRSRQWSQLTASECSRMSCIVPSANQPITSPANGQRAPSSSRALQRPRKRGPRGGEGQCRAHPLGSGDVGPLSPRMCRAWGPMGALRG